MKCPQLGEYSERDVLAVTSAVIFAVTPAPSLWLAYGEVGVVTLGFWFGGLHALPGRSWVHLEPIPFWRNLRR